MSLCQVVVMMTWFAFGHGLNADLKITVKFTSYNLSYLFSTSVLRSLIDCTCNQMTSYCKLITDEEQDDYTVLVGRVDKSLTEENPSKFANRYRCQYKYNTTCEHIIKTDDVEDDAQLFYISDASCGLQCVGISWRLGISQTATINSNAAYLFSNTCAPDTFVAFSTKSAFQDCSTATTVSPKTVPTPGVSTNPSIVWNTTNVYPQDKHSGDGTIETTAVIGMTIGIIASLAAALVVVLYLYKRRMRKKNETQKIHQENSQGFVTTCVTAEINEKNYVNAYTEIKEDKLRISNPDENYETINEKRNSKANNVSKSSGHDYQNAFISTPKVEETESNNVEVGSENTSNVASQKFINVNGVDSLKKNSETSHVFDVTAQKTDFMVSHSHSKNKQPSVQHQEYFILDKDYSDDQPEIESFEHAVSHHSTNNAMTSEQPAVSSLTKTKQIYSKLGERCTDFKDDYNTQPGPEPGMVVSSHLGGHTYLNDGHIGQYSQEYFPADASTGVYDDGDSPVTAEDVEIDMTSSEYDLASE